MFKSFVDWLDNQIIERGLAKVLLATFGLLGCAGAVGSLFGPFPLRASVLAILVLCGLAYFIYIHRRDQESRGQLRIVESLLDQYAERLRTMTSPQAIGCTTAWQQQIVLDADGNAEVTRTIAFLPGREVNFIYFRLVSYSTPLKESARRSVQGVVREIASDGVEGARILTTQTWRSPMELRIFAHFIDRPLQPGEQITLRMEIAWPRYSKDLMSGGIESFDVTSSMPTLQAEQTVEIHCEAADRHFSASRIGEVSSFNVQRTSTYFRVFSQATDLKPGETFGVRIDKS